MIEQEPQLLLVELQYIDPSVNAYKGYRVEIVHDLDEGRYKVFGAYGRIGRNWRDQVKSSSTSMDSLTWKYEEWLQEKFHKGYELHGVSVYDGPMEGREHIEAEVRRTFQITGASEEKYLAYHSNYIPRGFISEECWKIQVSGFLACNDCLLKGLGDCSGSRILEKGENIFKREVPVTAYE